MLAELPEDVQENVAPATLDVRLIFVDSSLQMAKVVTALDTSGIGKTVTEKATGVPVQPLA